MKKLFILLSLLVAFGSMAFGQRTNTINADVLLVTNVNNASKLIVNDILINSTTATGITMLGDRKSTRLNSSH